MEFTGTLLNAAVVAAVGLILGWLGKGRFEAIERRFEAIDRRTGTPVWQSIHFMFKTTRALLAADLPRAEHFIEEIRGFEQRSGGQASSVPATAKLCVSVP